MKLIDLITQLTEHTPRIYGNIHNNCDLQSIRLYEPDQLLFNRSIIYLADTASLPLPTQAGEFAVLCYGSPVSRKQYSNSTFTLIYLQNVDSYQTLFNHVQDLLTEVQQITAGMHLLVNELLSDQGLQQLIDTAGSIFGNPVYVVDLQHKYLAISSGISPNNTFLKQENQTGYISDEGIQTIQKNKLNEKIRSNNGPYLYHEPVNSQKMLIDIIRIQGIDVGHIMIQEFDRPFDEFDTILLNRFSKLVAIELQKNNTFTTNKGVMYSYFLADLLKNPEVNTPKVRERLKVLGFNLKDDMYIIAIPPVSYHAVTIRLEIIIDQLRQILPGSIYMIYEDVIVFLISKDRYQGFSEYERERLLDFLRANNLKAGISNFFSQLRDTARFYRQALQAVEVGMRINSPAAVPLYYYRDYYIYQMLETCEKADSEIRFLIHPGLMNLYYYDRDKTTGLLTTLYVYLEHPGQTSKVAEILHIHKNTLLYRLGKIREITKCKFVDGEDYMNFGLSFKIMKYLQMY